MKNKFALVGLLVALCSCANNEANKVMYSAVGRPIVDIIKCMGADYKKTDKPIQGIEPNTVGTDVYTWSFTETPGSSNASILDDAASLVTLPFEAPLVLLEADSGIQESSTCKVIASVQDGIVVDFQLAGNTYELLNGPNANCSSIERGCLRDWFGPSWFQ